MGNLKLFIISSTVYRTCKESRISKFCKPHFLGLDFFYWQSLLIFSFNFVTWKIFYEQRYPTFWQKQCVLVTFCFKSNTACVNLPEMFPSQIVSPALLLKNILNVTGKYSVNNLVSKKCFLYNFTGYVLIDFYSFFLQGMQLHQITDYHKIISRAAFNRWGIKCYKLIN